MPEAIQAVQNHMARGTSEYRRLRSKAATFGVKKALDDEIEAGKEYVADADSRTGKWLRAGQTGNQLVGVMLTLVIAAAVGFVGVDIISSIDEQIDPAAGSDYENATNELSSGFTDAVGFYDIVALVLMFGVVLVALLGFRR